MSRSRPVLTLVIAGALLASSAAAAQAGSLVRYRVVGGNAAPPRPALHVATDRSAVLEYGDTKRFRVPVTQFRTLEKRVAAVKALRPKSRYRSRFPVGDVGADVINIGRRRITVDNGAAGVPRPLRRLISLLEQIVRQND